MYPNKIILRNLFIWFTLCAIALGQTSTGRISGTVTDPSDAAVSNAKVIVTNIDTQAVSSVNTEANGFYTVTNLPIGRYSVEVSLEGFKTGTKTGLSLVADGRITADFALEVGSLRQSVEIVSTQVENLNTVSGEVSRVMARAMTRETSPHPPTG